MSAGAKRRIPQTKPRTTPRLGLALAGGGPLGAVYELGVLSALAEALEGVDFNELDVYVGVSAGGFIAAGLANGLSPRKLTAMFVESESADEPMSPSLLMKPALREYARRAASLPPLLLNALWHYISSPLSANFFESFQRLSRAIPTGVFDNASIEHFLERLFTAPGRSNDFRELRHKLFLVATNLDTGESVAFGAPGNDDVPISTAVRASAALPGLFPPVEIGDSCYVDGALKKTLHASVALDHGARLLLCINPLVPFDSQRAASRGAPRRRKLVEDGLPVVLAQTFRALIHSRMQAGMSNYEREYPDADVVLFEPNSDDADMFFTNMFSYSSRRHLSEHAYQKTRQELLRRYGELQPILARHGVGIRLDVLLDPERRLLGVSRRHRRRRVQALDAVRSLEATLDQLGACLALRGGAATRAA